MELNNFNINFEDQVYEDIFQPYDHIFGAQNLLSDEFLIGGSDLEQIPVLFRNASSCKAKLIEPSVSSNDEDLSQTQIKVM
jgi:hypothetical protein